MSKKTFTITATFDGIDEWQALQMVDWLKACYQNVPHTVTYIEETEDDNGEEEISAPVQESP